MGDRGKKNGRWEMRPPKLVIGDGRGNVCITPPPLLFGNLKFSVPGFSTQKKLGPNQI